MSSDLAADTTVIADPSIAGRYHVTLSASWDFVNPSGGVVTTVALRAAAAHLNDPRLRFASATAIFCTPLHATRLVADVTELRRGRNTAQVRISLRHLDVAPDPEEDGDNGRGLEVTATFIREGRKGPDVRGSVMPTVRSVADSLSTDDTVPHNPHKRFAFFQQLEARIADGERFWAGPQLPGPSRFARWFRYRTPQRDAEGRFDRFAIPPIIDTMPTALHRAIGDGYRFYSPSLDLTTYVIDDTKSEWLLVASTVRRAREGWAIGDCEVWDEDGRLIATGSQAMYIQGLHGEPPTLDASRA
ncbi:MAG TPA: thioesterase family protein [Kofleriaceae bacterium]|jgi:acyl-CoA thioesterase